MTYRIGLTGLIGSGKSLAADIFAAMGVSVIDTDLISHQLTAPGGTAILPVAKHLGEKYIDVNGGLNRSLMRENVFSNDNLRIKLESILHPLIFDIVVQQIAKSTGLYTIIVVPLLFKSVRYLEYVQRSIFVDCDFDIILQRVISRSNLSKEEVIAILKTQTPRNFQLNLADDILVNNGTRIMLENQIKILDNKYKNFLQNKEYV